MRVRLERRHEADAPPLAGIRVLLDGVCRVDDHGNSGMLVTDEVRPAPQVLVDELHEEHGPTLATDAAISPKVKTRLLITLLAALVVPAPAWAHATLVRLEPANGSVLARAPRVVRVVFDDTVTAGPGVAAIRNGGGSILDGRAHVEGGRTLAIPLRRGLPNGDYSVRWSIVSDDGHLESGVLAFAVGVGHPPPLAGLTPGATGPSTQDVVARWLAFAGILGAVGISLFALVARPGDEERVGLILSSSAVLAALGSAEIVNRAGLGTRSGAAFGAGFLAAVVVATGAAAATLDRRALRPTLFLALGLAAVPPFGGHALDRGLSRVNVVADALHILGAAAWVGVLVGLVAVRGGNVRRAGLLALGGVLVLGATGIVRAIYELVSLSQLWDTSYGRALLVKTGLLLAALAGGWLLRTRVTRRAGVELFVIAGILVAVSVLVDLRPGRSVANPERTALQASEPSAPPPPPPAGAAVLARELGSLGVAVAVQPQRTTVTVLSPAGGGLSGLDVRVRGESTVPCGSGCYTAAVAAGRTLDVQIGGKTATFALPARATPADALMRRVRVRYRALRSVVYDETLASDETHALVARWRLERPDRLAYSIAGGAEAIVTGTRRWDRARSGARWVESQLTPLPQPETQWTYAANAHVIARTSRTTTVSFVDPTVPAYFTVVLERSTLLPRVLHMTASAHFMTDRYVSFNRPRAIFPPR
jgi:copper transport protein